MESDSEEFFSSRNFPISSFSSGMRSSICCSLFLFVAVLLLASSNFCIALINCESSEDFA